MTDILSNIIAGDLRDNCTEGYNRPHLTGWSILRVEICERDLRSSLARLEERVSLEVDSNDTHIYVEDFFDTECFYRFDRYDGEYLHVTVMKPASNASGGVTVLDSQQEIQCGYFQQELASPCRPDDIPLYLDIGGDIKVICFRGCSRQFKVDTLAKWIRRHNGCGFHVNGDIKSDFVQIVTTYDGNGYGFFFLENGIEDVRKILEDRAKELLDTAKSLN